MSDFRHARSSVRNATDSENPFLACYIIEYEFGGREAL